MLGKDGRRGEFRGDVPWPVSPRTMMANRACTARSAMRIMSSMLVGFCLREWDVQCVVDVVELVVQKYV